MHKRIFVLVGAVFVLLSAFAYAQTGRSEFILSKKTFINEHFPASPYGNGFSKLYVGKFRINQNDGSLAALIQFDTSPLRGKHILSSHLVLGVNVGTSAIAEKTPYDIGAFRILNEWDDASVAWNTAPLSETIPISTSTLIDNGEYKIANLEAVVSRWVEEPSSNHGLLLKGVNQDSLNVKFLENIRLIVEYQEISECTQNSGICRSTCGIDEEEARYDCGYRQNCCVKKAMAPSVSARKPAVSSEEYAQNPKADFDGDGRVDDDDTGMFKTSYDNYNNGRLYDSKYDMNNDNDIDFDDFFAYSQDFGKRVAPTSSSSTSGILADIEIKQQTETAPPRTTDRGIATPPPITPSTPPPLIPAEPAKKLSIEAITLEPQSPTAGQPAKAYFALKNYDSSKYSGAEKARLVCTPNAFTGQPPFKDFINDIDAGELHTVPLENLIFSAIGGQSQQLTCLINNQKGETISRKNKDIRVQGAAETPSSIRCQGTNPDTTVGTTRGSSEVLTPPAPFWRYQESPTTPPPCTWRCDTGYHKDGASCVADVS